ncbi:MAG: iron-containing alcohol dehydrogenase, partial [Acetobacteraceae bacterium]|nr:iron-containing alcohol dehydrogenase [Acetobacteraceae bacterium]
AAREAMMVGAHHGGLAFSNSSVALVHGMSRPIGAFFHVPHGLSNAMLLPAVTRFSAPAALPRYADCARAMGVAQEHEGDQSAVARMIDALEQLNADLHVPSPRSHGIVEETYRNLVPTMAAQAIASGSPGNNPREATAEEIGELYLEAYG